MALANRTLGEILQSAISVETGLLANDKESRDVAASYNSYNNTLRNTAYRGRNNPPQNNRFTRGQRLCYNCGSTYHLAHTRDQRRAENMSTDNSKGRPIYGRPPIHGQYNYKPLRNYEIRGQYGNGYQKRFRPRYTPPQRYIEPREMQ